MIIALEGIDGAGKSTQACAIKQFLSSEYPNAAVGILRFPMRDSPSGKKLNEYLASDKPAQDPDAINILFSENRCEAIDEIQKLDIAILDRYTISGRVYAECDHVSKSGLAKIKEFDALVPPPDLTLFLRIKPELAISRILARNSILERNDCLDKLQRLAKVYDGVIRTTPKCLEICADQHPEAITRDILNAIRSYVGL